MQRIALTVEYVGSAYSGWQRQHHSDSVQARLEKVLSQIAGHSVEVVCSGRTDAGVHAWQQCVHFDTDAEREHKAWCLGSNSLLPADISVRRVVPVSNDFNARYGALRRSYRYHILNRSARSALSDQRVAVVHGPLDAGFMADEALCLEGEHDFSSFRAAGCQARHARRRIESVRVCRRGDRVVVDVVGNAFLHNMVRIIVGSLLRCGQGLESRGWLADVLGKRDRTSAGKTAPAGGLYFMGADYAAEFAIPDWRTELLASGVAGL